MKWPAVRIVLIVLLFVIWESSLPGGDRSVLPPAAGAVVFVGGYVAGCLALAGAALWVLRARRSGDLERRADRFNVAVAGARLGVVLWFAAGVYGLGWRPLVDRWVQPVERWRGAGLALPGTAVGLLPGLLGWVGLWVAQYPVDRAIHERNLLPQLEADLPVFELPRFGDYVAHKLRVQLLFTAVPLTLILLLRDVAAVALSFARRPPEWVAGVVDGASVVAVLVGSPAVLRHVLSTAPLPPSRLRDRLEAVGRNAGVRCREILLWRTNHNLGNAAVMGLLRQVRYVLLSDLLVATMTDEQVQAVFAHELGHVRHRHLAWLVGTLGLGIAALDAAQEAVDRRLRLDGWAELAFSLGAVVAVGATLWVAFGLLSRWFERQADVYAARLMDRTAAETVGAPRNEGVGAGVFASALLRVATVNNIPVDAPNWTHGSIADRVRYVRRFGQDPAVVATFDRADRRVKLGLVVGMIACATVAAAGALK